MSLQEVKDAIVEWQMEDELAQSPGFCRRSALKMAEVAQKADISKPHAKIDILAWPEATAGENAHYALQVSDAKATVIFNPVRTALFPQYNGPIDSAPGRLHQMVKVEKVL